jgi:hypothetical protein
MEVSAVVGIATPLSLTGYLHAIVQEAEKALFSLQSSKVELQHRRESRAHSLDEVRSYIRRLGIDVSLSVEFVLMATMFMSRMYPRKFPFFGFGQFSHLVIGTVFC